MMTRCAPSERSKGMENSAFSRVVRDLLSNTMAVSGTPLFSSNCPFALQSPNPATKIFGAAPCLKSSAARSGRSRKPPPSTTIASAFTGPLSTVRTCCGKNQANAASAASSKVATTPSEILKHQRLQEFILADGISGEPVVMMGVFCFLPQRMRFENIQHLISGEQPAKHIARAPVQKPELEDVAVEKPQRWTKRQSSRPDA